MPEEFFVLIMLLFMMVTTVTLTGMVLRHRRQSKEVSAGSRGGDSSLTTSELERLMRRAVEEGTAPLVDKIEELELELARTTKALPAAATSERISFDDELDEAAEHVETTAIPSATKVR